jgi:hypothetical protein
MMAIALFTLGLSSTDPIAWAMVAPLMILNMLHPFLAGSIRLNLSFMGYLILTLPFAFLYQSIELTGRTGYISDYSFAFYFALYMGCMGLVKLYSAPDRKRIPRIVLASALILTSMGGDMGQIEYGALVALYSIALLVGLRIQLEIRPGQTPVSRRNRAILPLAFLATVIVSVGLILASHAYYFKVGNYFMKQLSYFPLEMSGGFSNQATMTSISEMRNGDAGREIAVRSFGRKAPGYIRGAIFMNYGDSSWTRFTSENDLRPVEILDDGTVSNNTKKRGKIGRLNLPDRAPPLLGAEPEFHMYPSALYKAHYFLPVLANAINTRSGTVIHQGANAMRSKYRPTTSGYAVFMDPAPYRAGAEEGKFLSVPASPAFRAILDTVISRLHLPSNASEEDKVRALTQYFNREYTYKIGVEFVPLIDPIAQFLGPEIRHGHCELFATAGTLLLRRLGVQARYVTGFVCEEKNPYGDLYLARNRHGHAWIEYYHPQKGWDVAEFTPSDGVPRSGAEEGWDAFLDYLRGWMSRLYHFGFSGLLNLILQGFAWFGQWILGTWYRALFLTLLLGAFFFLRIWRKRNRLREARYKDRTFPADLESLRRRFAQLEKELKRIRLGRHPGETLDEYATRLADHELPEKEAALTLIRTLAERRYRPF